MKRTSRKGAKAQSGREMLPSVWPDASFVDEEPGIARDWYVGECPRTDAVACLPHGTRYVMGPWVPAAFARVLERELKRARRNQ